MSGYLYKGVSINQITTGGTATNNYFKGFPTASTNLNMFKPYPFGFVDPSGDIANRCTAASALITSINSATTVSVPQGCNAFRYIMLGGGGGGGGNGGNAEVNYNVNNKYTSNAQGGHGVAGGNAEYVYSTNDIKVNSSNIVISIGTGGSGGSNGANDNNDVDNSKGKGSATGGNGNTGGTGNSTIIYHGNYVFKTDNFNGLGGGSGNGGYAYLTSADNKSGNNGGNTNAPTTQTPSTQAIDNSTGGSLGLQGEYGNGGAVNVAGSQGAACIIWLYN